MLLAVFNSAVLAIPNSLSTPTNVTWNLCDGNDALGNLVSISNVAFKPQIPVPGKLFTQTIQGTLAERVTGASGTIFTSAIHNSNAVQYSTEKIDICKDFSDSCPNEAGPVTYTRTSRAPSHFASGSYVITTKATTNDGKRLFCVQHKFVVG